MSVTKEYLYGATARIRPVEVIAIAEEVASTLRHDLRNKFAAIRNAVFYIERSLKKGESIDHDPRIGRFLELICEQLDAADGLLDQRAAMSAHAAAPEHIRLGACVDHALLRRNVPDGVQVRVELTDRTELTAPADELALAIDCLLDNAFEAVDASGAVTIRTKEDDQAVYLSIRDTGPGLTPEQRARAVTPFSSDKPGHVGLGLNIASRVASRLGGTLEVATVSDEGGARWILTIPKGH